MQLWVELRFKNCTVYNICNTIAITGNLGCDAPWGSKGFSHKRLVVDPWGEFRCPPEKERRGRQESHYSVVGDSKKDHYLSYKMKMTYVRWVCRDPKGVYTPNHIGEPVSMQGVKFHSQSHGSPLFWILSRVLIRVLNQVSRKTYKGGPIDRGSHRCVFKNRMESSWLIQKPKSCTTRNSLTKLFDVQLTKMISINS